MTRKDYVLIASRILIHVIANDTPQGRAVLTRLAHGMADDLYADNPNFDPDLFLTNCGVK